MEIKVITDTINKQLLNGIGVCPEAYTFCEENKLWVQTQSAVEKFVSESNGVAI